MADLYEEGQISKVATGFLSGYCVYLDGICKQIVDNTKNKEFKVKEEKKIKK